MSFMAAAFCLHGFAGYLGNQAMGVSPRIENRRMKPDIWNIGHSMIHARFPFLS